MTLSLVSYTTLHDFIRTLHLIDKNIFIGTKDDRIPSHHLGTEEFASVSTMSSDGVSLPSNKQRDLDYKKGLVSDDHRGK